MLAGSKINFNKTVPEGNPMKYVGGKKTVVFNVGESQWFMEKEKERSEIAWRGADLGSSNRLLNGW